MKILLKYIESLHKELNALNDSWIPSEEIEKIYSPNLARAIGQYIRAQQRPFDWDNYQIVETILREISDLDYHGEINCCEKLTKFKNSSFLDIYQAFQNHHVSFSMVYNHSQNEAILKIAYLFLKHDIFSANIAQLIVKPRAPNLFEKLIDFIFSIKAAPLLAELVDVDDLYDIEIFLEIIKAYQHFDLHLNNHFMTDFKTIIRHPNLCDLYQAINHTTQFGIKSSRITAINLQFLPYAMEPLKLLQSFDYLEKFKLRNTKIDQALVKTKRPELLAELYKFLVDNQLPTELFHTRLSEEDITLLYYDYFQNPKLEAEEKKQRLLQFFKYAQLSKNEFNSYIYSLIKLIQIKKYYQAQLPDNFTMQRMLELFQVSLNRKLGMDIVDHRVLDIQRGMRRLFHKDYDYHESYSDTRLKELFIILYLNRSNNHDDQLFMKLFKQYIYYIQTGTEDDELLEENQLSPVETFIQIAHLVELVHGELLKTLEKNCLALFNHLIDQVENNIKSFFSKKLTLASKEDCLNILFSLQEDGISGEIWQEIQPAILTNLTELFPKEQKLKTIVSLGQKALPPIRELNEIYTRHFQIGHHKFGLFQAPSSHTPRNAQANCFTL